MGCGQSKINLYPRKNKSGKGNSTKKSGPADCKDTDEEEGSAGGGGETKPDGDRTYSYDDDRSKELLPLTGHHIGNIEASPSQIDFFKMLDEKIEQGKDYDSTSENEIKKENERKSKLIQHWRSASQTSTQSPNTTPNRVRNNCKQNQVERFSPASRRCLKSQHPDLNLSSPRLTDDWKTDKLISPRKHANNNWKDKISNEESCTDSDEQTIITVTNEITITHTSDDNKNVTSKDVLQYTYNQSPSHSNARSITVSPQPYIAQIITYPKSQQHSQKMQKLTSFSKDLTDQTVGTNKVSEISMMFENRTLTLENRPPTIEKKSSTGESKAIELDNKRTLCENRHTRDGRTFQLGNQNPLPENKTSFTFDTRQLNSEIEPLTHENILPIVDNRSLTLGRPIKLDSRQTNVDNRSFTLNRAATLKAEARSPTPENRPKNNTSSLDKVPTVNDNRTSFKNKTKNDNVPFENKSVTFEKRFQTLDSRKISLENRQPLFEKWQPSFENRPTHGNRQVQFDNRPTTIEKRVPILENRPSTSQIQLTSSELNRSYDTCEIDYGTIERPTLKTQIKAQSAQNLSTNNTGIYYIRNQHDKMSQRQQTALHLQQYVAMKQAQQNMLGYLQRMPHSIYPNPEYFPVQQRKEEAQTVYEPVDQDPQRLYYTSQTNRPHTGAPNLNIPRFVKPAVSPLYQIAPIVTHIPFIGNNVTPLNYSPVPQNQLTQAEIQYYHHTQITQNPYRPGSAGTLTRYQTHKETATLSQDASGNFTVDSRTNNVSQGLNISRQKPVGQIVSICANLGIYSNNANDESNVCAVKPMMKDNEKRNEAKDRSFKSNSSQNNQSKSFDNDNSKKKFDTSDTKKNTRTLKKSKSGDFS